MAATLGTALLVHGLWGDPQDWRWVREFVEGAGAVVITPDLPSHRSSTAGLLEDADEVRAAIRGAAPPVVVAGWSYGGTVVGIAAEGEPRVVRLVYVNNVPAPARDFGYSDWIDEDPHVLTHPDGTFVLDNDWWLDEDGGPTFPPEVLSHLRGHPRRRVTRKSMSNPQPAASWQSIPTTVVWAGSTTSPARTTSRVQPLECRTPVSWSATTSRSSGSRPRSAAPSLTGSSRSTCMRECRAAAVLG